VPFRTSNPSKSRKTNSFSDFYIPIVSILASFCVWTKSLKCKDAVNRDSTFRVMSVVSACKSEEFQVPCQPSERSSHPVWTPICPLFHPSGRHVIPSGRQTDQYHLSGQSVHSVQTPYCIEKFLCQLASVRTFQHHVRTPPSTRSVSDFFPNSKKRKISQPFGRCGNPSGRASP
jgi:hypothetical protein